MSNGPNKRPRGRPKSVDRQAATALAMATWWRDGLHTHTLTALCQQIGLSKPSLYRAFGSEDGLMEAALEHYRQLAVVPLLALLAADESFDRIIGSAITWLTSDHGTPVGCLFTRMRLSIAHLGPKTAARVRAMEEERREALAACYRRGLERGEVDAALSPELAARYLDAQLTTALVQWAAGESPEQVRTYVQLALRGLLSSGEATQ